MKAQGLDIIIKRCRQKLLPPCSLISIVPIVVLDGEGIIAQLLQRKGRLG